MEDPNDVLGRLQALLASVGRPEPPKHSVHKDGHGQMRDRESGVGSAQADALVLENRALYTQLEDIRVKLDKAEKIYNSDQVQLNGQREMLQQAETALKQFQSTIATLQAELETQSQTLSREKQSKEQAEVTMSAAKTQLSKIAKEKHELVQELGRVKEALEKMEKRAKHAEDGRSQLSQEVRCLQQRPLRPTGPEVASLWERVRASDLKLKTTEDQVKYLRLQNDGLLSQIQVARAKESPQTLTTNHPHPLRNLGDPTTPTPAPISNPNTHTPIPITILPTPRDLVGHRRPWDLIWSVLLDNLPTITKYIPILFRLITKVDPSATQKLGNKRTGADPSSRGTMIPSSGSKEKMRTDSGSGSGMGLGLGLGSGKEMTKADVEQKLIAEKAALKRLVRDRDQELSRTKEKMESLLIQNRALNEEFRGLEKASQEASRRKRERAIHRANRSSMVPERASSRHAHGTFHGTLTSQDEPRPGPGHERNKRLNVQDQPGQDEVVTEKAKVKSADLVPQTQSQVREAPKPDYSQLLTPHPRPISSDLAAGPGPVHPGAIPMDILAKVLGRPQPTNDPFIGLDLMFGNESRGEYREKNDGDEREGHDGQGGHTVQVEVPPVRSNLDESPSSFIYGGRVV